MRGALAYEVTRIRTIRSTYWMTGLILVLTWGLTILIALGINSSSLNDFGTTLTYGYLTTWVVTGAGSFLGVPILSAALCAVVGAMSMGHEYRYGTIKQTLTASPNRVNVFVAKCIVLVAWSAVVMVLVVAGNIAAGALFMNHFTLTGAAGRPIVDYILYNIGFTLAGLGLAGVLRNLAGALVAVLVWPFVLEPIIFAILRVVHIGGLNRLSNLMPASAGRRTMFSPYEFMAQGGDTSNLFTAVWSLPASIVVYWVGIALLLGAAVGVFISRDA